MSLLIFIIGIMIFIAADVIIRFIIKKIQNKKLKAERSAVLDESLKIDFSKEATTLKRVEVDNPKARILCVDDEEVILGSFRKILVLEGYSVDTVEKGAEALRLVQMHHYDFVFTDLKMPEMDGVEVCKAVKHLRPDIDVIIITGYASVQTAVETMKFGAMDYVEKPFTEDELLDFAKKILIKRQDRIQKQLKPKVHITHLSELGLTKSHEFAIPGGVFISSGHCWASLESDGTTKVGLDDFANKLIGKIDNINFPNLGMHIKKGDSLFSIKQGHRTIQFNSPITGKVNAINHELTEKLESIEITSYEKNWICAIDVDNIDDEIRELKIGKSAVSFYHEEIEKFSELMKKISPAKTGEEITDGMHLGAMESMDDFNWDKMAKEFFSK
ncbi:MAG: response regulator [bacterium]